MRESFSYQELKGVDEYTLNVGKDTNLINYVCF